MPKDIPLTTVYSILYFPKGRAPAQDPHTKHDYYRAQLQMQNFPSIFIAIKIDISHNINIVTEKVKVITVIHVQTY